VSNQRIISCMSLESTILLSRESQWQNSGKKEAVPCVSACVYVTREISLLLRFER
jgi:hypothetical protein